MKKNLSREIRCARIDAGVSQTHLANVLHRTQAWVSLVESGEIRIGEDAGERILKAIKALENAAKTPPAADLSCLALPLRIGKLRPGF